MSENHQVVMVTVDVAEHETVTLSEVFGRVPVQELRAVLASEWAVKQGWRVTESGRAYCKLLTNGVLMELSFDEAGEVRLCQKSSSHVPEEESEAVREKLRQMVREMKSQYNLAFNSVLARALSQAIRQEAETLGEVISYEDNYHDVTPVYEMEMKVYVEVFA